jgi:predicted metal-dependent HD superfamily phosphohydrolase
MLEDPMPTDYLPMTDEQHADLMARWQATLPHQEPMGEALIQRYREPHRRYHNLDHLQHVLRMIDELADDHDVFLVRLAAWFHDAIYDIPTRELTNEDASARLSLRELSRAGLEQEDLTQVARLVRLTATHVPGSRDPEGELLCDADLAILAAPPAEYAAYVDAVRAEYAAVPEADFVAGRLAILEPMTEGELFRTSKGKALTEAAQANLAAECRSLQTRLDELMRGSQDVRAPD